MSAVCGRDSRKIWLALALEERVRHAGSGVVKNLERTSAGARGNNVDVRTVTALKLNSGFSALDISYRSDLNLAKPVASKSLVDDAQYFVRQDAE